MYVSLHSFINIPFTRNIILYSIVIKNALWKMYRVLNEKSRGNSLEDTRISMVVFLQIASPNLENRTACRAAVKNAIVKK